MTANHTLFANDLSGSDSLRPWLLLGPIYKDVSTSVDGLSLFEGTDTETGRRELDRIRRDIQDFLPMARAEEEKKDSFFQQEHAWHLCRMEEPMISVGHYFTSNHAGILFAANKLFVADDTSLRTQLHHNRPSHTIIYLNGQCVYDRTHLAPRLYHADITNEVELNLSTGWNDLRVAVLRIGRSAQVSLRMDIKQDGVRAAVATNAGVAPKLREEVEKDARGFHLVRDLLRPGEAVQIRRPGPAIPGVHLSIRLHRDNQIVLGHTVTDESGEIELPVKGSLTEGKYSLEAIWQSEAGKALTSVRLEMIIIDPLPAMPGQDKMAERRRRALSLYAAKPQEDLALRTIWQQLAHYAMGSYASIDADAIEVACAHVRARQDCSDFILQGLLRLLAWDRKKPNLSPHIRELIKETVLDFKYWYDEPGNTLMFMGSENHRMLFHTAEWMAGTLFPLDEFSNSRQRGLFHASKARMLMTEWMRQRLRFGFDEWHSDTYYPISMLPLLNIYDFAAPGDAKLRLMAHQVLDYMCFNLAADSFDGVLGTPHARTYSNTLKHLELNGSSGLIWMLYGLGSLTRSGQIQTCCMLATSAYAPPAYFSEMACDGTTVVDSRIRQSGPNDGHGSANISLRRTPDYQLGAVQDYRKGRHDLAAHAAQITLRDKIAVFWSCPETSGEGGGMRPDYWSGSTSLPRTIHHGNLLSLSFKLKGQAWMSHCYFDCGRFDQVIIDPARLYARKGDALLAIMSQNPFTLTESGPYAHRELICTAAENTWIAECACAGDWKDFDAFVAAFRAARMATQADGSVCFDSPVQGCFVTGWDVVPTIDNQAINLGPYPLVDSPWAHSRFGSGEIFIHYGDQASELWGNL